MNGYFATWILFSHDFVFKYLMGTTIYWRAEGKYGNNTESLSSNPINFDNMGSPLSNSYFQFHWRLSANKSHIVRFQKETSP